MRDAAQVGGEEGRGPGEGRMDDAEPAQHEFADRPADGAGMHLLLKQALRVPDDQLALFTTGRRQAPVAGW